MVKRIVSLSLAIILMFLSFTMVDLGATKVYAAESLGRVEREDFEAKLDGENTIKVPGIKIDSSTIKEIFNWIPWPSPFKEMGNFLIPRLFDAFVTKKEDPAIALLNDILANTEEIMGMINTLGNKAAAMSDQKELAQILRKINELRGDTYVTQATMNSLEKIEREFGTFKNPDKKLTEDEKKKIKAARISALADDLGAREGDPSITLTIDKLENCLYSLLTSKYVVSINGEAKNLTMSQIFAEFIRIDPRYLWEHEAEDIMNAFNYNMIVDYMMTYSVEVLSLQARIQACEARGIAHRGLISMLERCESHIKEIKERIERPYTSSDGGFMLPYGKDTYTRHIWSRANGANCDYYIEEAEVNDNTLKPFLSDFFYYFPGKPIHLGRIQYYFSQDFVENQGLSGVNLGEKVKTHWEIDKDSYPVINSTSSNNNPNEFWQNELYQRQKGELLNSNELAQILKAGGKNQNLLDIMYRAYGGDNALYEDEKHKNKTDISKSIELNYNRVEENRKVLDEFKVILPCNDPNGYGFCIDTNKWISGEKPKTPIEDFLDEFDDWDFTDIDVWDDDLSEDEQDEIDEPDTYTNYYFTKHTMSCHTLKLASTSASLSGKNCLPKADKQNLIAYTATYYYLPRFLWRKPKKYVRSLSERLYNVDNNIEFYFFKDQEING